MDPLKEARVKDFINKVRVLKVLRIDPKATNLTAFYPGDIDFARSIMDGLIKSIHLVENGEDDYERVKGVDRCAFFMIAAETHGALLAGTSIEHKIAEKNRKIAELEQKLSSAEQSHDDLVNQYDEVRQKLANLEGQLADCNDKYDKLANAWRGKGDIQQ